MNLCNFYNITEYSFFNSTIKIKDLICQAKKLGYKTLAISDLDNMYGTIEFYQECLKENIKPIIGLCLTYLDKDNNLDKLLLYAVNSLGYQNLLKISTIRNINQQVTIADLMKYRDGLAAIIPSSDSSLFYGLLNPNTSNIALDKIIQLTKIFNLCYFGYDFNNQDEINNSNYLINLLITNHINPILIHKTNILNPNEAEALDCLRKIQDEKAPTNQVINSFLSSKDFQALCKKYPFLLNQNDYLASISNVSISLNLPHYPKFKINQTSNPSIQESNQYLQALSIKGLEKRLKNTLKNPEIYLKRLKMELKTIIQMGYADYFLIVCDIIRFAKKNDIMVGPGRGSAVGSLVSYALGITEFDPIEYNLLFERFLNTERVTMPDIDIDFESNRRGEVIEYVKKKYGQTKVANIITFTSYGTKTALMDVAKVYNLAEVRRKQIIKYIDSYNTDKKVTLKEIMLLSEDLRDLFINYPDIQKVCEVTSIIEELPKNTSTHASGIVISSEKLTNIVPLEANNEMYQTAFEGVYLEKLGLLKIDFLALRDLNLIKECLDKIQKVNPNFIRPTVFNDFKTYSILEKGLTKGIFQLESAGMKKILKKIKPHSFNDLVQILAIYRPGSMGMIDEYLKNRANPNKIDYLHPTLEGVLKETYGIMIYQEQIMQIYKIVTNATLQEADILRRAIAKKQESEMVKIKADFMSRAINNGYPEVTANKIFSQIEKFAGYGFNKSHAVAYASISYLVAYMKANYPVCFYSVFMNEAIGSSSDLNEYFKEALSLQVTLLSPNILYSNKVFRVKNQYLLLPLSLIKGLTNDKCESIIANQPYNSFEEFVNKNQDKLTIEDFEKIIYSGACDNFKLSKMAMIKNINKIIERKKYALVTSLKPLSYISEEYPYETLMEKEKLVLGFNIKYNVFNYYQNLYSELHLTKLEKMKPNNFYKSLVKLVTIKKLNTKKQKSMIAGIMEDDNASMNYLIFNDLPFELEVNKVYQIDGKYEERMNNLNEKEINFIINEIKEIL